MERGESTHLHLKALNLAENRLSRRFAGMLIIVIGLLPMQAGCYHYRVIVPEPDPATDYEHRTVHSFLWGLLQSDDVQTSDCLSNAIDEVRVTTNLGYAAVSVLTLGIWVPLDVQWRCAKEPSTEGVI